MSLINKASSECMLSELDLFTMPPTQASLLKGEYVQYLPVSTIADKNPITFNISGNSDYYIDLAETYLYLHVEIKTHDNKHITPENDVGPTNLLFHTLWKNVIVKLNSTNITRNQGLYHYKAYLDTLLTNNKARKESMLSSQLFYEDTAGSFDIYADNEGLASRKHHFTRDGVVELYGRLNTTLFNQPKLLLTNVDVQVTLERNSDAICLLSDEQQPLYTLNIIKAVLSVRRELPNTNIRLTHEKLLQNDTAKYIFPETDVRVFNIAKGSYYFQSDNILNGRLPTRLYLGMIENDAFTGSFTRNCFNFKHFDVNYVSIFIDGQQFQKYETDFEHNRYLECFHNLSDSIERHSRCHSNGISRESYKNGNTLFCFDLTPGATEDRCLNLIRRGNLRIELRFTKPLPRSINLIIYSTFTNVIEVDKLRNILYTSN